MLGPRYMPHRLCQSSFIGPPVAQSGVKGIPRHADSLSPFAHAFRDAVQRQESIRRRVSGLLLTGRPSAIRRLVVAVVVNALNLHARWAFSHVIPELFVVSPRTAYGDASATVPIEAALVVVSASGEHLPPDAVRPCHRSVMPSLPVRLESSGSSLLLARPASAALGVAGSQVAGNGPVFGAALALTTPHSVVAPADKVQRCQTPKRKPRQVAARSKPWHYRFASIWASMMRRTSSASEMPRRFASRLRNARCGSVKEIICFVMGLLAAVEAPSSCAKLLGQFRRHVLMRENESCDARAQSFFGREIGRSRPAVGFKSGEECDHSLHFEFGQVFWHTPSIPRGIYATVVQ
jgi:hypothetical protein